MPGEKNSRNDRKKEMIRGFFITFEGMEGSGKSTQIQMLADSLAGEREIIVTRSPGGTPIAEKIRDILKIRDPREEVMPETELLLFAACHSQMTSHLVAPALKRGAVILCDRFYDSTMAYQGYARTLNRDFVAEINAFSCRRITPDLTLVLDLDPAEGIRRSHARASAEEVAGDRFDSEKMQFHHDVRNAFLDLAAKEPERFAVIDAGKTAEEVHRQIMEAVHARLEAL